MLDDLTELRTFRAIMITGSLSAAARQMAVGLPVVSKRLASLERRAGTRLVHRTTRKLSPTEDGVHLLAHVERMLEELGAAEEQLTSGQAEPRGLLRVSAPISFGRVHVAPIVGELVRRYAHLSIELELDNRLFDLIGDRIDVAIHLGQIQDSSIIMRKLADNRRILVASPDYLDRNGRPRTPEDLVGHSFLRWDDGRRPWRLEGPRGVVAEVAAPPRLYSNNGDALHDWATAGVGIMFKSLIDVGSDLRAGRLERVLADWSSAPVPICALFPSGRHVTTKARTFLDAIVARIGALS